MCLFVCLFFFFCSKASAAVSFLCLFLFNISSKYSFHLLLICCLSPVLLLFLSLQVCMRFYLSFIFCTTLYACLGFVSLNSCSVAINCWLVTCLFFFPLHAVFTHFLFFAYSALFAPVGQAKYAWFCRIHLLQQLSSLVIKAFLVILVPFLISRYVNCCVFYVCLIGFHCISGSMLTSFSTSSSVQALFNVFLYSSLTLFFHSCS